MTESKAVESVLFLKPTGGDHSAIRKFFEDEQVLEHASRKPGFLGSKLHSPVEATVSTRWSRRSGRQRMPTAGG